MRELEKQNEIRELEKQNEMRELQKQQEFEKERILAAERARIDYETAIFEQEFNSRLSQQEEMKQVLIQQQEPLDLPPCAFGDPDLLGLSEWDLDL